MRRKYKLLTINIISAYHIRGAAEFPKIFHDQPTRSDSAVYEDTRVNGMVRIQWTFSVTIDQGVERECQP